MSKTYITLTQPNFSCAHFSGNVSLLVGTILPEASTPLLEAVLSAMM